MKRDLTGLNWLKLISKYIILPFLPTANMYLQENGGSFTAGDEIMSQLLQSQANKQPKYLSQKVSDDTVVKSFYVPLNCTPNM